MRVWWLLAPLALCACLGPEPSYLDADGGGGTASGTASAGGGAGGGGGGVATDQPNGASCGADGECASGFCDEDDAVCCDAICNGICVACIEGKTGMPDGVCAPIPAYEDPDMECAEVDPMCSHPTGACHACDGMSGCRLKDGAACGTGDMCISNICGFAGIPGFCQPM